jgi:hypothetical protein
MAFIVDAKLNPVTLGNLFGGTIMVGVVYYVIYRRGAFRLAGGGWRLGIDLRFRRNE